MKHSIPVFALLLLMSACGSDDSRQEAQQQPAQTPQVSIPIAGDDAGETAAEESEVAPVDMPDLTGLSDVEKEIFTKTIRLQVPYYKALETWADKAIKIEEGVQAAASLRTYISLQEDFARSMQKLDVEFAGKIDPNYAGSEQFARVLDSYMNDPEIIRKTEYIMRSYMELIQRFRDDPACKEVFADIEKMAREAQGME